MLFSQVLFDLISLLYFFVEFISLLVNSFVEGVRMILTHLEGHAIVKFIQVNGMHFGVSFLGFLIFFNFFHLVAESDSGLVLHLFPEVGVVLVDIVTGFEGNEFIEFLHVFGFHRLVIFVVFFVILNFLHSGLEFLGRSIHLSVPEIGMVIVLMASLEGHTVVELVLVNSWVVIVIFNFLSLDFPILASSLLAEASIWASQKSE